MYSRYRHADCISQSDRQNKLKKYKGHWEKSCNERDSINYLILDCARREEATSVLSFR